MRADRALQGREREREARSLARSLVRCSALHHSSAAIASPQPFRTWTVHATPPRPLTSNALWSASARATEAARISPRAAVAVACFMSCWQTRSRVRGGVDGRCVRNEDGGGDGARCGREARAGTRNGGVPCRSLLSLSISLFPDDARNSYAPPFSPPSPFAHPRNEDPRPSMSFAQHTFRGAGGGGGRAHTLH